MSECIMCKYYQSAYDDMTRLAKDSNDNWAKKCEDINNDWKDRADMNLLMGIGIGILLGVAGIGITVSILA